MPQRSILFGIPLAVFIFSQWWLGVSEQESVLDAQTAAAASTNTGAVSRRKTTVRNVQQSAAPAKPQSTIKGRMAVAGACAGLLPLIHAHTFLVVMAAAVCLAILFRTAWRSWTLFFAVAIPLSLPEIWWLAHSGGVNAKSYLGWQPGWDHSEHNILWFWFVNAGPFILALLAALLWRGANFSLPRRLIKFYIPFLFCFMIPNLVKLAPWVWDNIKVLFLWYIASTPLVALLLARWWEQRSRWRWLAPVVFGSMILAGSLDILRVIAAGTEQREFEPAGIAIARSISEQAAPQARVLHAPTYNTPVFLTGRRSLLGYPGWMWSRGLDFTERDSDIRRIYAGGTDAGALLEKYQVDYILVGPQERGSFPVNEQFLSQYKKVAQAEAYQLYQIKMERLRTGK